SSIGLNGNRLVFIGNKIYRMPSEKCKYLTDFSLVHIEWSLAFRSSSISATLFSRRTFAKRPPSPARQFLESRIPAVLGVEHPKPFYELLPVVLPEESIDKLFKAICPRRLCEERL